MDINNITPYDITSQLPRVGLSMEQQHALMAQVAAAQQAAVQAQQQQQQQQPQPDRNVTYPCAADVMYIQQQLAAGSPASLVIPPTQIPLYPGYSQVPPGPGFVYSNKNKYNQLLAVIREMSQDLRPTYTGSKMCGERFKRGIAQARILLRECLAEHERALERPSQGSMGPRSSHSIQQ